MCRHLLLLLSPKANTPIKVSRRAESWVDLGRWLHTETIHPPANHPSTKRARHWSRPTRYRLSQVITSMRHSISRTTRKMKWSDLTVCSSRMRTLVARPIERTDQRSRRRYLTIITITKIANCKQSQILFACLHTYSAIFMNTEAAA